MHPPPQSIPIDLDSDRQPSGQIIVGVNSSSTSKPTLAKPRPLADKGTMNASVTGNRDKQGGGKDESKTAIDSSSHESNVGNKPGSIEIPQPIDTQPIDTQPINTPINTQPTINTPINTQPMNPQNQVDKDQNTEKPSTLQKPQPEYSRPSNQQQEPLKAWILNYISKPNNIKFLLGLLGLCLLIPLLIWLNQAIQSWRLSSSTSSNSIPSNSINNPSNSNASNAILYVDPTNGNDRNAGTLAAPLKTLSHALSIAQSDRTIQLAPGKYNTESGETLPLSIPNGVTLTVQANSATSGLSDIKNHWAEPFIQPLADRGIIKGYPDGTFQPDANLTRAEYAALLTKAFQLPEAQTFKLFQDIGSKFWGYSAIQSANSAQFLKGFPNNVQDPNDDTFQPNEEVKREQVIAALVSGLKLAPNKTDIALNTYYTDWSSISSWANTPIKTATLKSLVVNYPNPNQLNPTQSATRAQIAAMLYQALVEQKQLPKLNSAYIVQP